VIRDHLADRGIELKKCLRAHDGRYWSRLGDNCPTEGIPYGPERRSGERGTGHRQADPGLPRGARGDAGTGQRRGHRVDERRDQEGLRAGGSHDRPSPADGPERRLKAGHR
jgi:hypothetical protein